MRSNCYFKLKKQIEALDKKIKKGETIGNQDVSALTTTVNLLQQDLLDNSNRDQELTNRVGAIESGENTVIDDNDIVALFGG